MGKEIINNDSMIMKKRCVKEMILMVLDKHKGDVEFSCDESKTEIIEDIAEIIIRFSNVEEIKKEVVVPLEEIKVALSEVLKKNSGSITPSLKIPKLSIGGTIKPGTYYGRFK